MADVLIELPNHTKRIPRRGLPKVKSGCITCKERRVKCGEEKPECLRCIRFGTDCGGYPPRRPKISRSKASLQPKAFSGFLYEDIEQLKLPRKSSVAIIKAEPSTNVFRNDGESRYFDVFSRKTAFEILPIFAAGSFRRIMLQASQSDPSIRHAIVALGALDKTSQLVSTNNEEAIKVNLRHHHESALNQYALALKHMREGADAATPDLRKALLHCLVTLCFEAWNGNQSLAMAQIQTGFKLIQAWKEETNTNSPLSSTVAHDTDLLQIFSRLDVQAISFAQDGWLKKHPFVTGNTKEFWDGMPSEFESLEEADRYNNGIARRSMHILSSGTGRPRKLHTFPVNGWWGEKNPTVVANQQALLGDCHRWLASFEPLWQRVLETETLERIIFAKLQRVFVRTALHGVFILCCSDEMLYDQWLDSYSETVDFCEDVLKSLEPPGKWPPDPKFSFDSIVIIPLYLICHKCRDRTVRRKAISLLLTYSRREGVWDSIFAGKMGQWAMEIEEEYIDEQGRIPAWARIHGMAFENQGRKAILTCEQQSSETSTEMLIRHKTVAW
ncbi:hypothetical protein BJ875DRAFT_270756 [Amylocarpus encephaloides]|uniref:Zn(2)-C6 fungal-type domain-containing protein n=1 Tax=Amylocarpus encephaloides TaxID=45428 RepID=A0A9P8C6Q3_9HELO|nr:hypothetical protein BJ875DRAFT_270756 [Amylocarpus encephaloides]